MPITSNEKDKEEKNQEKRLQFFSSFTLFPLHARTVPTLVHEGTLTSSLLASWDIFHKVAGNTHEENSSTTILHQCIK